MSEQWNFILVHAELINSSIPHQLSPYPTSMFDADGQMQEAKTKDNPKNIFKVQVSSQNALENIDASLLGSCAIFFFWESCGQHLEICKTT